MSLPFASMWGFAYLLHLMPSGAWCAFPLIMTGLYATVGLVALAIFKVVP